MKLHHCAYTISRGNSQIMQDFCEYFNAKLVWEGQDQGREIVMKFNNGFCIQFSEMDDDPLVSENKQETHLAFASENPKLDLQKVKDWFAHRKVAIRVGQWSDTELWIDCPDVFLNFVIEIVDVR